MRFSSGQFMSCARLEVLGNKSLWCVVLFNLPVHLGVSVEKSFDSWYTPLIIWWQHCIKTMTHWLDNRLYLQVQIPLECDEGQSSWMCYLGSMLARLPTEVFEQLWCFWLLRPEDGFLISTVLTVMVIVLRKGQTLAYPFHISYVWA